MRSGRRTPPCQRVTDDGEATDEPLSDGCPHSVRQHLSAAVGCLACPCMRSWAPPSPTYTIGEIDLSRLEVIARQLRAGLLGASDLCYALGRLRDSGQLPDPISRLTLGVEDHVILRSAARH